MNSLFLAARADFGFGNPNLAGALFAMLAVGVWGMWKGRTSNIERPTLNVEPEATIRDYRFWFCLGLSGIFAGLMVMTASRGAVVALGAGFLALWAAVGYPWPRLCRAGGVVAAILALGILAGQGRMGERVAESSGEDGSITCRVDIFKAVPAMLAAAPQGWGRGQSAEAYQNWFQATEDVRTYKHLLSTHATWMVESGWGFRFFYILGWLIVLVFCWNSPACLGVWVVYGVAGLFSHVGGDWRLGVLPSVALLLALWVRAREDAWPGWRVWRNGFLVASMLTVGLASWGAVANKGIVREDDRIRLGSGAPKVWVFAPDLAVLGKTYGKTLRERGPVGVVWNISALPTASSSKILLSGSAPIRGEESFSAPYELIWLNPPARLDADQKRILEMAAKKTIVWGELRTDASPRKLKVWFENLPDAKWRFSTGKGLFLGEVWMSLGND